MAAVDHVTAPARLDGPCGWAVDPDLCGDCSTFTGLPDPAQAALVDYASQVLWEATGRRYGACPVTVRPCRDDCQYALVGWPSRIAGSLNWTNTGCGCSGPCGCGGALAQVTLPGPVVELQEVLVDGVPLDLSTNPGPPAARVDNWTTVVRQDGLQWPTCQHLGDPPPGGWSITYLRGIPLPAAGRFALTRLVCELAKACEGQPCRLPSTATNVTRQGVTVNLPPVDVLTQDGYWGLPEVDQWIAGAHRASARPPISPDVVQPRLQTWPPTN